MIDDMLASACNELGHVPERFVPLAGDASHRRFFRAHMAGGETLVACLYPQGALAQAERDWRIHAWAWRHALPVPRPLGRAGAVTLVEDLGSVDLESALAGGRTDVIGAAFAVLGQFQSTGWADLETPPFDAVFLRRELADFERLTLAPELRGGEVAAYLDRLVTVVASHPRRLVHRDFHANNLFAVGDVVKAIDFQDMRGGPDTYDAVSLLRERAGASWIEGAWARLSAAAEAMSWDPGWEERYWQCAAQRGLKVVGTFLRLSGEGRGEYLRFLPDVRRQTAVAVKATGAPEAIRDAVAASGPGV
ncbi:MAG: phosphotransferase [Acidobacteriota bacterium]